MASSNIHAARIAKKRRHKPGNLDDLTRVLWQAILEAEAILHRAASDEQALRAVHAVSQSAGQYAKLLEVGEMHARLEALEKKLEALGASRAS